MNCKLKLNAYNKSEIEFCSFISITYVCLCSIYKQMDDVCQIANTEFTPMWDIIGSLITYPLQHTSYLSLGLQCRVICKNQQEIMSTHNIQGFPKWKAISIIVYYNILYIETY